jgi:transposase
MLIVSLLLMTLSTVPDIDINSLPQGAQALIETLSKRAGEADRLEQENRILKELLRLERIKKYGGKSEALSDAQLELLEEEPSVEEAEVATEAALPAERKPVVKREHAGRNELPAHLPRKEEILVLEAEKRTCPCCGAERHCIGYEEKEELDLEPLKYFVRVVKREKLACGNCPEEGVVIAPIRSEQILEKSKLSSAVMVDVLIKKYCEHQPLYRQQATLERDFGIEIARTTLCEAVMACGSLLQPIAAALKVDLINGGYIQADETPIGVQSEQTLGRNHTAFAFQYSRPGGPVVFDFRMSRGREGPKKFLQNYGGILQSDGFTGYEKIGSEKMIRAGCMAHARRKFVDALKLDPTNEDARKVLALIARLYRIEAQAREGKLCPEKRLQLRQAQSAALFVELRAELLEIRTRLLPSSSVAKACSYALNQWEKLATFLHHGVVEIDQNCCENGMRPVALGRKNWLHIGSEQAGPKIAAILSVLETCKRLKVHIRDYLGDVLPKLGNWPITRVSELTPLRWATPR